MPVSAPVVEVEGLVKHYGDKVAVDHLSFTVEAGEVYGLLGVNGAGKTTTIEILEGHRRRTAGNVRVLGVDPQHAGREFRDRIGIVLQSSGVEAKLTVREVLELYRPCYSNPRTVHECIELLGLGPSVDTRIDSLSGGQTRRVDFALGVIGRPQLLFLDEPTTGFDPSARRASWELIRSLGDAGTTVILTSHYLDEVEHLAHRVGVIAGGRMLVEGTPDQLLGATGVTVVRFECPPDTDTHTAVADVTAVLGTVAHLADVRADGDRIEVRTAAPTPALHLLSGWALDAGRELGGIEVRRPSLEDLFIDLVASDRPGGAAG